MYVGITLAQRPNSLGECKQQQYRHPASDVQGVDVGRILLPLLKFKLLGASEKKNGKGRKTWTQTITKDRHKY